MYIKAAGAKGHPNQDSAARRRAGTDADDASEMLSPLKARHESWPQARGGSAIAGADRSSALVRVVNVFKNRKGKRTLNYPFGTKRGEKEKKKKKERSGFDFYLFS